MVESIDYEICVNVFRSVSSGPWNDYVLKRKAIEDRKKFGKEAVETPTNNFYVDDLLKSMENEDVTI